MAKTFALLFAFKASPPRKKSCYIPSGDRGVAAFVGRWVVLLEVAVGKGGLREVLSLSVAFLPGLFLPSCVLQTTRPVSPAALLLPYRVKSDSPVPIYRLAQGKDEVAVAFVLLLGL